MMHEAEKSDLSLLKIRPSRFYCLRPTQPLEQGRVIEPKRIGGLHHQYVRMAA